MRFKKVYRITNKDEYFNFIFSNIENEEEKSAVQAKALLSALDIRKFEIELYWKRAAYFWAFIAASYAGYFILLNSDKIANNYSILLLVGILGFLFSYIWYFINRGSKFWQNNWEAHVDFLEDEVMGKLYKTVKYPNEINFFKLNKEYPLSVSKLIQLLSLFITLTWLYLIYIPLAKLYNFHFYFSTTIELIIIEALFLIFITLLIYIFTRSSISKNKSKTGNSIFVAREE